MPRITDVGQLRTHLIAFRRAQRLTQTDLAERLGVTKQRISAIEAAPERVTVGQFLTILRAIKADLVLTAQAAPQQSSKSFEGW
jgi:HTH-type transcriptional regulator / antitoxin HipB